MLTWQKLLLAAVLAAALASPAAAQRQEQGRAERQRLVERGAYLVTSIAACGNCHTPKGPQGDLPGMDLAGGMVIEEPGLFRAIGPNITPEPETGIGRWTDAQIATAIREGKRPDGTLIGPPMPIELYRGISDRDLAAMIAYLRSVPPVRNAVGRSRYEIPLPPGYGPPVGRVSGPPAGDPVARGAYLAGPLGHCIECHTPMRPDGRRDWSRTGAGGPPMSGPQGAVLPRNITPSHGAGLGGWTDAQIIRAVTQGISADGHRLSPPMAFNSYARIRQQDLRDLVAYLRSLPARD